jgi:hypothetical protein
MTAATDGGHYEVELLGPGHSGQEAGWQPATVSLDDVIPSPLTFGSLGQARSYTARDQPSAARIIWVTEAGERLVIETLDPEGVPDVFSAKTAVA